MRSEGTDRSEQTDEVVVSEARAKATHISLEPTAHL